jgi:hypothetical protein
MRIPTTVATLLMMLLTACSAATPTGAAAPVTAVPEAAAPDAPMPAAAPPPGAAGKISPDMVGKVSPVPAFKGLGEHFNIEIQSHGEQTPEGMRHSIRLVWGMGTYEGEGTLFYRSAPGPARGAPILLDGTLQTAQGPKKIRVEIVTEPCTDDADRPHPQRVTVALQGETGMQGCGDLAVY